MCGDIEHPLIIDGESVRVGPKQFSEREIAQLKTLREGQTVSTYEIFESLDQTTRECGFEFGTFDFDYDETYTGQHQGMVPQGSGVIEFEETFIHGTYLNGEQHGIELYCDEQEKDISEMRDDDYVGLETSHDLEDGTFENEIYYGDDSDDYDEEVDQDQPFWDLFDD